MSPKFQRAVKEMTPTTDIQRRLTRSDAYRLYQVLGQLKGLVSEPRYVYALVMARKKLQPMAEAIEEMVKPPERVQQYEQQRQVLCQDMALKDDQGKPRISPEQHFMIDPLKQSEFNEKLGKLHKEYQPDIDAYQTAASETNKFLLEATDIEGLPQIPFSALGNSISMDHMEALLPILIQDNN